MPGVGWACASVFRGIMARCAMGNATLRFVFRVVRKMPAHLNVSATIKCNERIESGSERILQFENQSIQLQSTSETTAQLKK